MTTGDLTAWTVAAGGPRRRHHRGVPRPAARRGAGRRGGGDPPHAGLRRGHQGDHPRFAANGYLAICPNLYSREAPGVGPDDAAAAARAKGGVPDERLVGDVAGAAAHLRSLPDSNGRVGHHRLLLGRPAVVPGRLQPRPRGRGRLLRRLRGRRPPEGFPLRVGPIVHLAPDLSCPLLGLFGADDQYPSPEQVAELERALTEAGKEFEFHSYEGAGHAFFATDRPSYRPEAANDGWARIWAFFGRHLAG